MTTERFARIRRLFRSPMTDATAMTDIGQNGAHYAALLLGEVERLEAELAAALAERDQYKAALEHLEHAASAFGVRLMTKAGQRRGGVARGEASDDLLLALQDVRTAFAATEPAGARADAGGES